MTPPGEVSITQNPPATVSTHSMVIVTAHVTSGSDLEFVWSVDSRNQSGYHVDVQTIGRSSRAEFSFVNSGTFTIRVRFDSRAQFYYARI